MVVHGINERVNIVVLLLMFSSSNLGTLLLPPILPGIVRFVQKSDSAL